MNLSDKLFRISKAFASLEGFILMLGLLLIGLIEEFVK